MTTPVSPGTSEEELPLPPLPEPKTSFDRFLRQEYNLQELERFCTLRSHRCFSLHGVNVRLDQSPNVLTEKFWLDQIRAMIQRYKETGSSCLEFGHRKPKAEQGQGGTKLWNFLDHSFFVVAVLVRHLDLYNNPDKFGILPVDLDAMVKSWLKFVKNLSDQRLRSSEIFLTICWVFHFKTEFNESADKIMRSWLSGKELEDNRTSRVTVPAIAPRFIVDILRQCYESGEFEEFDADFKSRKGELATKMSRAVFLSNYSNGYLFDQDHIDLYARLKTRGEGKYTELAEALAFQTLQFESVFAGGPTSQAVHQQAQDMDRRLPVQGANRLA